MPHVSVGSCQKRPQRGRVPARSVPSHLCALAPGPRPLGRAAHCHLSWRHLATWASHAISESQMTLHRLALNLFLVPLANIPNTLSSELRVSDGGGPEAALAFWAARDVRSPGAGNLKSRTEVTADTRPAQAAAPAQGPGLGAGEAVKVLRGQQPLHPTSPRPPWKVPGSPHCTAAQSTAQGHRT